MRKVVLDASALLALINDEPGAAIVQAVVSRSYLSTVNLVEVRSKLIDYGPEAVAAGEATLALLAGIVPFTEDQRGLPPTSGHPPESWAFPWEIVPALRSRPFLMLTSIPRIDSGKTFKPAVRFI